jgi:hypothetical protein
MKLQGRHKDGNGMFLLDVNMNLQEYTVSQPKDMAILIFFTSITKRA